MSYILDALKKSSEERRKHEAERQSTFQTMEEAVSHRKKTRTGPVLFIILLLAIIAAASATGSWIFFTFHKTPEKVEDVRGTIVKTDNAEKAENTDKKDMVPPETQVSPETVSSRALTSKPLSPSPSESVNPKLPPPAPRPEKKVVPLMEDLPLEIQSAIPEMKFSGHVFSQTPSLRMIMINTTIVREKEMVVTDLRLLEITESGLIMEFRGNRFRVELF